MKSKIILQEGTAKPMEAIICKRAHVVRQLGRTIFADAIRAGWIAPCAHKPPKGQRTSNASTYFVLADVEEVKKRLLSGQYPVVKTQKQKKK